MKFCSPALTKEKTMFLTKEETRFRTLAWRDQNGWIWLCDNILSRYADLNGFKKIWVHATTEKPTDDNNFATLLGRSPLYVHFTIPNRRRTQTVLIHNEFAAFLSKFPVNYDNKFEQPVYVWLEGR